MIYENKVELDSSKTALSTWCTMAEEMVQMYRRKGHVSWCIGLETKPLEQKVPGASMLETYHMKQEYFERLRPKADSTNAF